MFGTVDSKSVIRSSGLFRSVQVTNTVSFWLDFSDYMFIFERDVFVVSVADSWKSSLTPNLDPPVA